MTNRKSILVTRPAGQAYSLINRLSSIGCHVSYQPMLEIREIECPYFLENKSLKSKPLKHIIFVSTNAVRFGLPHILSGRFLLTKNANYYAVGSATAKLLFEAGIDPIFPTDKMTSEGLLELVPLSGINGENVALIKGEGGRDYLAEALEEKGANVIPFDCYRRVPAEINSTDLVKLIEDNNIEMAIFSSAEGILRFISLIEGKQEALSNLTLLVASPRIATIAKTSGWKKNLLIADNARDDSFVKAVVEWLRV